MSAAEVRATKPRPMATTVGAGISTWVVVVVAGAAVIGAVVVGDPGAVDILLH